MSEWVELWETPTAKEIVMIVGWRQWADAGSLSSGLPEYLVEQMQARQIGRLRTENCYLFQIPGTHDLVRPVVDFEDGFPVSLEMPHNDLYYSGDAERGVVFLLGDEPHLQVNHYANAFFEAVKRLKVQRVASVAGVYGEFPYNKERLFSCIYSQPDSKRALQGLAVNFSGYQGGASIGSVLCYRASQTGVDYMGFYGFVPTYDFSNLMPSGSALRIEDDYTAWLGVMRRLKYLFKLDLDLTDLENKSQQLMRLLRRKLGEIDQAAPQFGIRQYLDQLSEGFTELTFAPLDDVWQQEISRLFDDDDAPAEG
ncbi:MAG: PAC2 family protein [Anaerolineae bacterium]|nr:PAC2 family protein [Anaerolineae bacterium]